MQGFSFRRNGGVTTSRLVYTGLVNPGYVRFHIDHLQEELAGEPVRFIGIKELHGPLKIKCLPKHTFRLYLEETWCMWIYGI